MQTLLPPPAKPASSDAAAAAEPVARRAPPRGKLGLLRRVLQDREALLIEVVDGVPVPLTRVAVAGLILTALAGVGLGTAAGPLQAVSSAVKTPLVTLGAIAVCFPAFFIFGLLQGSRLQLEQACRLFAVGVGLRGAILAGLAPLLFFFSSVGSPCGFLLLMGLVVFGAADYGMLRTVTRGVELLRERHADTFSHKFALCWTSLYLAVAVQLTWTLRPFIRHPDEAFAFIGGRGNMFTYFLEHVAKLFG